MKQKPTRDIEVGDRITRTRRGEAESIFTVAEVLSRRGSVRRVRDARGQQVALCIRDDGDVSGQTTGMSAYSYRREKPGDAEALEREQDINTLRRLADNGMVAVGGFRDWPIEDVRRVLAAWPEEKK